MSKMDGLTDIIGIIMKILELRSERIMFSLYSTRNSTSLTCWSKPDRQMMWLESEHIVQKGKVSIPKRRG